jgi:lipopolysaccharide transport system permease protein
MRRDGRRLGERFVYTRDVLYELVSRDLKVRYKRSVLGIVWSLLVPLAQLAVLYLVFNKLLPLNIPHYTTFLFTGILPWTWFQTSLLSGSGAIVENRDLVRQVGFPVAVLPTVTVISQLIHFLLALPILFAFLVFDGYPLTAALLALPVVIVVQGLFILSLGYIFATFQVRFRDVQYLLGIALFLLFYLTPVFYDGGGLPEGLRPYYGLNPMVHLLNAYRDIFTRGQIPALKPLLAVASVSAAILALSYTGFLRARDRFVEEM